MGAHKCIQIRADILRSRETINLPRRLLQHAYRVLRILGVEDQVEGVIYCDYSDPNFSCKPEPDFYHNVRRAHPLCRTCH